MRAAVVMLAVVCAALTSALARTLVVQPDGNGEYPTIQLALDAAASGDSILLGEGRFSGSGNFAISFPDKEIVLISASGDPRTCVIDCQGLGRAFTFGTPGKSPGVLGSLPGVRPRTRYQALIQGLTIRNGAADLGGAIQCNEHAAPTFADCILTENHASDSGGAVYLRHARAVLRNCLIAGNSAAVAGGGIGLCCCAGPILASCTVAHNSAPEGSGIHFTRSSIPTLDHSIIAFCGPGAGISSNAAGNDVCRVKLAWCNVYGNVGGDGVPGTETPPSPEQVISADPLFRDPASGDYRVQPGSPCGKSGNHTGETIGAFDAH